MRLPLTSLLAALLLSACSTSESSSKKEPATTAAADDEILFETGDYTVNPGDEKYICWAHNLPADRDAVVREVSGDYGPGTHHIFFGWTLAPETDGMSECPVLFKTTWIPIFLGGVDTSPLTMPDGAAVDLGTGKQLVLQLHLQNTTTEPIVNHVTMHLKLQPADQEYTPAGIFGLDNRDISLPANTQGVQTTMSCQSGKEMHVFSVLGHMHKLGKTLNLAQNGQVAFTEPWNFNEQPTTPFEMLIEPTDELRLTCTHDNPYDHTVTYGESSDTEMCAFVFYYTPYDQLGGCVNAPQSASDGGMAAGDGGL